MIDDCFVDIGGIDDHHCIFRPHRWCNG